MRIVTNEDDDGDDRIIDHRPRVDSTSDRAPPQRPEFWRLPELGIQIVPCSDVPKRDIDRKPFITPGLN